MRRTRRLGRYHLVRRIAFGGMAEVFRGFTFSADGERYDVAVKKLLPHYVEDPHFVTMLTDEYRLVSRLDHPNVARFFELTQIDHDLLISMEFVDGRDLRSTIDQAAKLGKHHGRLRSHSAGLRRRGLRAGKDPRRTPSRTRSDRRRWRGAPGGAPRSEPLEHAGRLRRRREDLRLRHRQGEAQPHPDQDGHHQRQGEVHVARASLRARARPCWWQS